MWSLCFLGSMCWHFIPGRLQLGFDFFIIQLNIDEQVANNFSDSDLPSLNSIFQVKAINLPNTGVCSLSIFCLFTLVSAEDCHFEIISQLNWLNGNRERDISQEQESDESWALRIDSQISVKSEMLLLNTSFILPCLYGVNGASLAQSALSLRNLSQSPKSPAFLAWDPTYSRNFSFVCFPITGSDAQVFLNCWLCPIASF